MKKIVSLLLALLFIGLYGCGESAAQASSTDSQQSSSAIDEEEESSKLDESSSPESKEEEDSGDDSLNCERPSDREMKLFCDLQMKEYDINNVTCTISYGAWEDWSWLYNTTKDQDDTKEGGALLFIENFSFSWEDGEPYLINATQNVGLPPTDYLQIKNMITISELRKNYTFQYDVKGNVVFTHSERLTIPVELFNKEEGWICIAVYAYQTYQWNYQTQLAFYAAGNYEVYYKKQGDKIIFSDGHYYPGL